MLLYRKVSTALATSNEQGGSPAVRRQNWEVQVTGPLVPREHVSRSESYSIPVQLVQFYDPARFPTRSVADYFCADIEADETSLLITTPVRTHQVKNCLEGFGVDTEALQRKGLLTCLDASSALQALRTSNSLDEKWQNEDRQDFGVRQTDASSVQVAGLCRRPTTPLENPRLFMPS